MATDSVTSQSQSTKNWRKGELAKGNNFEPQFSDIYTLEFFHVFLNPSEGHWKVFRICFLEWEGLLLKGIKRENFHGTPSFSAWQISQDLEAQEEAVEGDETAGMRGMRESLPWRARACPQEWALAEGTVQIEMFVVVVYDLTT